MNFIKQIFLGIFKEHKNCRVCSISIEDGGYGLPFVGSGFCVNCSNDLLTRMNKRTGK